MEDIEDDFLRGAEYAVSVGITSVQSGILPTRKRPGFLKRCTICTAKTGCLRYSLQQNFQSIEGLRNFLATEYQNDADYGERWLRRGCAEALQRRLFGRPYGRNAGRLRRRSGNRGVEAMTREQINALVTWLRNPACAVTHAIGDGAVEAVIDAYVAANGGTENPLRHGINHCQITRSEQLDRIVENNLAILSADLLDYDLQILEDRVGEEIARTSYAFGTLIRRGALATSGRILRWKNCNPFPVFTVR